MEVESKGEHLPKYRKACGWQNAVKQHPTMQMHAWMMMKELRCLYRSEIHAKKIAEMN